MPKKEAAVARQVSSLCAPTCPSCGQLQPQRGRYAFTAVLASMEDLKRAGLGNAPKNHCWMIGRADEGTTGYTPMTYHKSFASEKEARELAKDLNKLNGWTNEADAQMLVLGTMRVKEEHMASLLRVGVRLARWAVLHGVRAQLGAELEEWVQEAGPYARKP